MINKQTILGKLQPFKNYQKVVVFDQTVGDIISGILSTHEKYKSEYDKISDQFIGESELETARNIWNFLHSNVPYYVESTDSQTLRSPSAIVAMPGDCKSYALFANGIFDSLNRKGIFHTPIAYRFADYRNIGEFQHVFSVLNPGTDHEIWIDPVLPRFNQKKQPTSYKDKKIKMALIAMSGIDQNAKQSREQELKDFLNRLVNERDKLLNDGIIKPGSSKELEYKVAINKVTNAIQQNAVGVVPVAAVVAAAPKIMDLVNTFFKSQANPNDWMGWDAQDQAGGQWAGSSVRGWVLNDGDNVNNEAVNIASYIKAKGIKILTNSGHPVTIQGQGWRDVTIEEIADKFRRGGLNQLADQLMNENTGIFAPSGSGVSPQKAGMNMYLTLGLVGAALFLLTRKK